VARAAPPELFFTEFANATGWVHAGEKAAAGRITLHLDEATPVIAQIWGTVPEDIAQLAKECKKRGFAGIDINMGCPEKTAIKGGGGAAMCQNPALAAEVVAAAKTAGLPVSVKCRLGYSKVDEWENWISHLLKQDLAALTVHLRTKQEMSKVPAHWELMPEIRKLRDELAPNTRLIGNGDVESREQGLKLIAETGIDGVMIGRGIFTNPFCFEKSVVEHSKQELLNLLQYHLDLFEANHEAKKPYETLKRFFKIYVRDFPGSGKVRAALMSSQSIKEARHIVYDALVAHGSQEVNHQVAGLGHLRYHVGMHTIKAIVFDSDGTLVNTTKLIIEGYRAVLRQHGLEHLATSGYIKSRLGKPVPETYEQILAGHNVDVPIEQLVKEHDEFQNKNTHLIKPYPEAESLLKKWRAEGIKLCLFTSGNQMMIERNFTAAGIENVHNLFDAIITADDDLPRKPEPDAVIELLKRVNVEPRDAVIVGDHAYDIQAGSRAHAGLTIGILHGFGESRELLGAGADFLTNDLSHLNQLIQV
jgi:HAD superfamily hydrolase (TIGR01549 family)